MKTKRKAEGREMINSLAINMKTTMITKKMKKMERMKRMKIIGIISQAHEGTFVNYIAGFYFNPSFSK